MSSILTNSSATNALATLRSINKNLGTTQDRISSGLKVASGKDNAASFSIAETMRGDSSMTQSLNDGLTMTKNALTTARLGAETVADLSQQFVERVAFAQGAGVDLAEVGKELTALTDRMANVISQSTFNGEDYVNAAGAAGPLPTSVTINSGVARDAAGALSVTTMTVASVDLDVIQTNLAVIATAVAGGVTTAADLTAAEAELGFAIDAETSLGVSEKSIETQQEFLTNLSSTLDSGVGALVDANMEEEAARLQALQVQQQLASQSLSIANQAPQNILSLFR